METICIYHTALKKCGMVCIELAGNVEKVKERNGNISTVKECCHSKKKKQQKLELKHKARTKAFTKAICAAH